jgi:hypothetical protein
MFPQLNGNAFLNDERETQTRCHASCLKKGYLLIIRGFWILSILLLIK